MSARGQEPTPARPAAHAFWPVTVACALVAAATANGFFPYARPLLVAVLPAILAALGVTRPASAALSAAAGTAAGVALAPMAAVGAGPGRWALLAWTSLAALAAAGAAGALSLLRSRSGRRGAPALAALALGFTLATMAWSALTVARGPLSGTPPLAEALTREPAPGSYWTDESIYARVIHLTRGGGDYYSSVRIAWNQKAEQRGDPQGVFSFRLPTLTWMAAALPDGAASLIPAMLAFGALAVLAAWRLATRVVRPEFALVGTTLVAIHYTREAGSPHLLQAEPWGAALALAGAAAWAGALTAGGEAARKRWTWAAAAACLAGALFREHLVFVPLVACALSLAGREARARRAWLPWSLALAAFACALAAHAFAAAAHTSGAALPLARWFEPGTRHLVAAVGFGGLLLGGLPWMPWLLVGLALAGAAAARPAPLRWFLGIVCGAPLAAFLVLRPPGSLPGGGQPGYWGAIVLPLLWAAVPLVFAWAPAGRRVIRAAPV